MKPNCPCRIEDGRLVPYSDTWENTKLNHKGCFYQVFDPHTRKGCGIGLGVSGSPIIQNGKLVGAVTHVCVNL